MRAPISNHQARTQASHDIIALCLDVVFAFAVIEGRTVYPQHAALCIIMKDKRYCSLSALYAMKEIQLDIVVSYIRKFCVGKCV